MSYKFAFLLMAALAPHFVHAEWDFISDTTVQGIHRNFPHGASKLTDYKEAFLESNTGFRFSKEDFQMEGRALLRSLQSPANEDKNDFAFADLTPPRRLLKLYAKIGDDDSQNQTVLDTGTLWASYNKGNWQFTGGRRAIGIGVLKVFPVWNRLYPIVPTLSGYMFVNNPDIIDLRWSSNQWTAAVYSIFSQFYDESINAVEFINYGDKLESHFLFSKWWDQTSAGYSGVVDTDSGIFRMESLLTADEGKDTMGGTQIGLGWEKAFTSKLSFVAEYYHSTFGTHDPDKYLLQDRSPFRNLLASDYFYPQVIYKFTDFMTNEFGVLTNLVDGSCMIVNQTSYSYSDNIEIFGSFRKPFGSANEEFGYLKIPVTNGIVEYVEWLTIGLKMTI